jgi:hypothetical protein
MTASSPGCSDDETVDGAGVWTAALDAELRARVAAMQSIAGIARDFSAYGRFSPGKVAARMAALGLPPRRRTRLVLDYV